MRETRVQRGYESGQDTFLREPAMAPRMRFVVLILAIVAVSYVVMDFNHKVIPYFSIGEHLWGHAYIAGFANGSLGLIVPVALFMLWWTGFLAWVIRNQHLQMKISGLLLVGALIAGMAIVYGHNIKLVWSDEVQRDGFYHGLIAALVFVCVFFYGFAMITNRMPKPWHNRANNPHHGGRASQFGARRDIDMYQQGEDELDELVV